MNKYAGTIVLTIFVVLLAVAILKTMPARLVGESEVPIIRNTTFPLTSIANPECQYNSPDLYMIEPKLYENVKGSVKVLGQAVGSFENNVVMTIVDDVTKKVLLQDSTVIEPNYPCTFSKEFQVGNFAPGGYTVQAYFTSPKDGSVVKEVEVPIRLE